MEVIRLAGKEDFNIIMLFDPASTEPERRRLVGEAIAARECYVCEHTDEVAGYGILHHHFFGRGFIELVIVAPKFRRRGIASALMQHLEKQSRTPVVFTSTNESNLTMQNLLDKLGYHRSGVIENLDPGDPELVYCRKVAS